MKVRTEKLKELVARSIKASSCNKLIPITSLMKLELKDGKLTLETTDSTNYLYISEKLDNVNEVFYAVVDVDLFSKLIARTTSEFIELTVRNDMPFLQVNGNGSYTIEMPLDENGVLVQYPDPLSLKNIVYDSICTVISSSAITKIISSVKPSLAVTYENPCYTGYFAGDNVIATDVYKIAGYDTSLFNGTDVLLSPETVDLLGVFTSDKIDVYLADNAYIYKEHGTETAVLYSPQMEGKDEFAVTEIEALLDTEFAQNCTVRKLDLLAVLDRLSLFISPYDKNAITLTFGPKELQISSKNKSGYEIISYSTSNNSETFICEIDVEMFTQEVKAIQSETIIIEYGLDNAIKLIDNDLTIIIALSGDE